MKMKFTPVVILLLFLFSANAQSPISLTSADMPTIGFSETYAVDTPLTSVNYGNAGANQVYDFSTLSNTHTTSISYVAVTNPQHTNFPTANQALYSNGSYIMLDSTSAKYQAVGLSGIAYGNPTNTPLSPAEDVYHFPTQYQSIYASNWGFYQAFDGNTVGQTSVDSVREIYTDHFSSVVDGWGKVITPVGSYRGLRIKRIDTMDVEIDALYAFIGNPTWHNVTSSNHVITSYTYVSKETKGTLVSFNYNDTTNAMRDAQYSLIPPAPPVAGFSQVIGNAGLVTFTDTSEGFPTRYHWNFGDGDTANTANPSHTYAANGTYYVCETVYNPSGSNTVCDSVHVTSVVSHVAPVAVNDSAVVHQPNADTINVTGNDHSPSNDPFCVKSVYGGSYFSVLGCNNVAFNPTGGFTGYDTCHYIICNTNQPTLCDTAELIVHVIATATHLPPVALDDAATDLQGRKDTLVVTANDHSPSGDNFCVTRVYGSADFVVLGCNDIVFTPVGGFTGYDTVWYIECNTGQPTLCDTARVIVHVIQQHVAPVAVNDLDTALQATAYFFNVTVNDHSPSSDSFCIHSIYGSPDFSILNCTTLAFSPDSMFTGNDTAWYVVCNTGQPTLCDTASVIVTVNANSALLPVSAFSAHQVWCGGIIAISSALNADSLVWEFRSLNVVSIDSFFSQQDTVECGYRLDGVQFQVCLTSFNKFGSSGTCDTLTAGCEGINEVQLSGIRIYPNPVNSQLSIDMRDNTSGITKNYTAIEIYNAIGQKVETVNRGTNADVVNVNVSQFCAGIYLATIIDGNGARSTLGKFTVMQ